MKIIHIDFVASSALKQVIHELANKQCAAGLEVEVWQSANSKTENDYELYETKYFNTTWLKLIQTSAVHHAIKSVQEEAIFHLHGAFVPELKQIVNMLSSRNIPYVFTPHADYRTSLKKSMLNQIKFSFLDKKILNKAYAIHVLNHYNARSLKSVFSNKKTIVIPHGFNLFNNHLDVNKPASRPFIVAFSGEIDIVKNGLDVLVKGFKTFHKKFPDSKLWIIGDGAGKSQLKELVERKGLESAVRFYEQISEKEKAALLQQCHVFAQPSRSNEFSTEAFEAASLGVPCLVTKTANVVDGIKNYKAGYVIDGISSLYISQGLNELYHKIILRGGEGDMRLRAKMMIKESYNWNTLVNKYQMLYTNIINKSSDFAY